MPLAKLTFKPGVNKETTSYGNEMGWFDSSLIRFRKGRPEKMGGWTKLSSTSGKGIKGTPRSLFCWVALDGSKFMGTGTSEKFFIEQGDDFNDITPLRATQASLTDPFTSTSGSAVLTVTDVNHGAAEGDYVTFSGAVTFNGVAGSSINTNLQITSVISSSKYTVDTGDAADDNGSGGSGGAATVDARYEINTGLNSAVAGTGWGAGLWGGTTIAQPSSTTLGGDITNSATSIALSSASDFETASSAVNNSAGVTVNDTQIIVDATSGFPAKGTIKIDSENILYTAKDDTTNTFSGLTRGMDDTTVAAHDNNDTVTFVGLILVNNELIQYTGKSTNTLNAGVVRGARNTTAAAHSSGDLVKEANEFTGWGEASDATSATGSLRLWFQDNYGEDLFFNPIDDTPYYWDKSLTTGTRATALSAQTGASQVPTITRQIMISGEDRHVVCVGCNELGATAQNLLHVRWSDQENPFEWNPTLTNTAGGITLSSGSKIVRAIRTRQEILIYTDVNTHVMRFVGPPNIFSFALAASNTSLISPNAVVTVADKVFWMSRENFHVYTGRSEVIPCTVLRYIFDDINTDEFDKIVAGSNKMFDEVFWFYPSSGSTENDRYVKFNFTEGTWDIGTLSRTAWVDFGIHSNPRGAGSDSGTQYVYEHENTQDADGSAMTSYIESADFDLDPDGNNFMFITRLIPDVALSGSVDYVLKTRNYPGDSLATNSTSTVTPSTQQAFLRARSRQAVVRVESGTPNTTWTLGDLRLDIRPDGRR